MATTLQAVLEEQERGDGSKDRMAGPVMPSCHAGRGQASRGLGACGQQTCLCYATSKPPAGTDDAESCTHAFRNAAYNGRMTTVQQQKQAADAAANGALHCECDKHHYMCKGRAGRRFRLRFEVEVFRGARPAFFRAVHSCAQERTVNDATRKMINLQSDRVARKNFLEAVTAV